MTSEQQAIETLQNISDIKTNRNYAELNNIQHLNYDLFTAIKVLEKQVPKKPTLLDGHLITYKCPSCGKDFIGNKNHKYCYLCGQKIDWSGEE